MQSFAALGAILALTNGVSPAAAAEFAPPPAGNTATMEQAQSVQFGGEAALAAPALTADGSLPEGTQWRYSEFINAVNAGKVRRWESVGLWECQPHH